MPEIIPNWHPLLVHFTIALFSISIVLFIASAVFSDTELGDNCLTAAKFNLWIGALISILTGLAGWYAFNTVDHDTPSHAAMTDHRNWALVTLSVFFTIALWSVFSKKMREKPSIIFLVVCIVGGGLLMTTGFKGAETVYRYGLGVMSLPKVEGEGHAHEHGNSESHGHGNTIIESKDMVMPDNMKMDEIDSHAHDSGDHGH